MASQSASPHEAAIAAQILAELPPDRTLSAEDILSAPSFERGRRVRFYDARLGAWVVVDQADVADDDFWRVVDKDNAAGGYYRTLRDD